MANKTKRKVSWHCPNCQYLHVDDTGTKGINGMAVTCIVCKEGIVFSVEQEGRWYKVISKRGFRCIWCQNEFGKIVYPGRLAQHIAYNHEEEWNTFLKENFEIRRLRT